tara:strand:- start:3496 stop:4290 length:795 start_codon:yes stop_codon:yes gene_type:complete
MKVALCLYGLVGSTAGKSSDKKGGTKEVLNLCYDAFKKMIIDKNDTDVFFHTWDTDVENELVEKYEPKKYHCENQIVFPMGKWANDVCTKYEGKVNFDIRKRIQSHYSRWYSTQEVLDLKSQHENEKGFKYDMVMICRFDVVWNKPVIFKQFNNELFYISNTYKRNKPWGWPFGKEMDEVDDLWFFSNSVNMDRFGILFEMIDSYMESGCPDYNGISNHMLAKWHLEKLGLLPDSIGFAFRNDWFGMTFLHTSPTARHFYGVKI